MSLNLSRAWLCPELVRYLCSVAPLLGVVVTFAYQDRVQALIDSGIDMLIVLGTPDPDLYSELHLPFGLPVIGLEMLSGGQPGWEATTPARSRRRSSITFRSRVPSTSVGSWGQQRGTFEQWTPDLKQAAVAAGMGWSTDTHDGTAKSLEKSWKACWERELTQCSVWESTVHPCLMPSHRLAKPPQKTSLLLFRGGHHRAGDDSKVSTLSLMAQESGVAIADMCIATVTGQEVPPFELPFELTVRESSVRA